MEIYKAEIFCIDTEDSLLYKKKGTPLELVALSIETDYFSSKEKALIALNEEITEFDDEESSIVQIVITELAVDLYKDIKRIYYDIDLNEIGCIKGFDDYTYSTPKYKKDDWVLFCSGSHLEYGCIAAIPTKSENVYLIITEDDNVNDCSPHHHLTELSIYKSVTKAEAGESLPRKYFRSIERRLKDFT